MKSSKRFSYLNIIIPFFLVFFLFNSISISATKIAVASGDWNSTAVWQGGVVPQSGDSVVILDDGINPILVTIATSPVSIDAIVIDGNGNGSELQVTNSMTLTVARGLSIIGTLTATSGITITVGGNWVNNGTFTQSTSNVILNGSGTQTLDMGSTSFYNLTLNKTAGSSVDLISSFTIDNNLSVSSGTLNLANFSANRTNPGAGTLTVSNGATLIIGNTFPTNFRNVSLGATSQVTYNSTSASVVRYSENSGTGGVAFSYGNLTLTGSGTKSAADSLTISGNFIIDAISFSGGSNKTHRIAGNWTVQNGGVYNSNSANNTVIFNGTGSQQITGDEFRNLTISKSSGTLTLASNITIKNGNVNLSTGTFNLQTFTISRSSNGGSFTIANGATIQIGGTNSFPTNFTTYTLGTSSTVSYNGSTQTITAISSGYGNLSVSGSGDKTAGGSFSINGNLSATSIAFNGGSTTTTFSNSSTLSVASSGSINIGSCTISGTLVDNGISFNVSGNWSKSGTYTATGTVVFNGSSSQTIGASNFNNISFSGAGTKNISGDLTITGNWSNSSTVTTTQTITFNGTTSQSIDNSSSSFNHVTINKSSGTATAGANLSLNGNLSITTGTFSDGGKSISLGGNFSNSGTYSGTGTLTLSGTNATLSGSGTNNFNNFTLTGSGITLSSSSNVTISGNLSTSGSGTFTHSSGNSGTITMNGSSKTISGTGITFNKLSISGSVSTASFSIASDLSVSGSLTASSGTVTFSGTSILSGTANLNDVTLNGTTLQLGANSNLGIANSLSLTSGTFAVSITTPNTVTYNKNGNQTITSSTYYNLSLSGTGTKTEGGDITLLNSLDVANGVTFSGSISKIIIDGSASLSGSGTFNFNDIQINSTRSLSLSSLTVNILGNITNNGSITPASSTVILSGTSKTIGGSASSSFNSLNVSGSITTSNAISLSGNLTVSGSFSTSNNVTFSGSNANHLDLSGIFSATSGTVTFGSDSCYYSGSSSVNNVTVSSNKVLLLLSNSSLSVGNLFTASGTLDASTNVNTVLFTGSTQTIPGVNYYNLSLSGSGTKTATFDIGVLNNLTIGSSTTFNDGGKSITISGNVSNSGTYSGSTNGTALFDGNTMLSGAGTYNFNSVSISGSLNAGSLSLGVAKNWTNNGTFSSTGTVSNNGSGTQTISSSNFSSIVVSGTSTKTFSGSYTLLGNITVNAGPTFTSSGSTFIFNGTSLQTISGGSYENIEVDNLNDVSLLSNITVNGSLDFTSGDLLTNSFTLTLGNIASLNELPNNTLIGKVTTTRIIPAGNSFNTIGNIGIEIKDPTVTLGSTVVTRNTGSSLNGGGSFSGNSSIQRYFDIVPSTNSGLNASLVFHYDESELNSQDENSLGIWKSTNTGSTWSGVGGTVDASNNKVSVSGLASLSRFTAADGSNPLQPNSITVKVYRDKDGKSSTTSDWVGRKWNIELYRDSQAGQLVGQIDGDSVLTIDTLSSGTYVAVITDSSGWIHLSSRSNNESPDSNTNRTKSITISGGTMNSIDFANFHPGKITIRQFLDNDADFSTTNDRVGKKWNLIFYKNSISAQNIHSQVLSDSLLVDSLIEDGNYIVVQADSSGLVHLGYVSSDSTFESNTSQAFMSFNDGEVKFINFVNRVNLNTIIVEKYLDMDNNFSTDSLDRIPKQWGLSIYKNNGQLVSQLNTTQLVVNNLDPGSTYYVKEADSIGWRHIGYVYKLNGNLVVKQLSQVDSVLVAFSGGGNTALVQFVNSNADSAIFLSFTQKIDYSKGWGSGGGKVPKIAKKTPTKKPKALIKPSIANLLDTVFTKLYGKNAPRDPSLLNLDSKKFPNGLYLGVPGAAYNASGKARLDTVVIAFTKDAKSFRSFVEHRSLARGFDGNDKGSDWGAVQANSKKASKLKGVVKAKKPNQGTDNLLAGELAALKMNMAMYSVGVLPSKYTGYKNIVFDMANGTANPLNGKSFEQIASFVDTALTFWTTFYYDTSNYYNKTNNNKTVWRRYDIGQPFYDSLYQSLRRINLAFNDDVDSNDFDPTLVPLTSDTIKFYSPLKLKSGVGKPLYLSPFLKTGKSVSNEYVHNSIENTPQSYELYQNYPNPFNPTTTIEFYLPISSIVTMRVYNLLGQEVATLFNNQLTEEGYNEVSFDGSNLSSGVYFYYIFAAPIRGDESSGEYKGFTQTKKFVLVK